MRERENIPAANWGNGSELQSAETGVQNSRSKPATILRWPGDCEGSRVVTVTFSPQWGPGNVPADVGEMRAYLLAQVEWGTGNSIQRAQVDLRQGAHVSVPAETVNLKAWIQELEPDPGILLDGGAIAPQQPLAVNETYSDILVTAGVGDASGCANGSEATRTYPQQALTVPVSHFYEVPPFANSVRVFWQTLPVASDVGIALKGGPTSNAQTMGTFDAAAVGSSEIFIPGGVTHLELDPAANGPHFATPVFFLNL